MAKRVFRPILDEELLRLFKAECAKTGATMQFQVEDLIRAWLESRGIVMAEEEVPSVVETE